jgi:uncharacterized protein (DUF1800 family)
MRSSHLLVAQSLVATCLGLLSLASQAQTVKAVEFYNTTLKHYFLTAVDGEVKSIDSGGAGPGWKRTGGEFSVHGTAVAGTSPVCRFYGTPNVGPNSHFYTVNADECEAVKKDKGWTYEGIAFYAFKPSAEGNCASNTQPIYRSYNNGHSRNDANHRFLADVTAYANMPKRGYLPEGVMLCVPIGDWEVEADIVRLLEQATFGPTEALVKAVKAKGIVPWLDEQLGMNVTQYTQYPYWARPAADKPQCVDDKTPPTTPEKFCQTFNETASHVVWEFFRQSQTATDQVRLRVAHNWHHLFIVGDLGHKYAQAEFHQRLRNHGLSTYEQLLFKYTISPQLGFYQSWVKNIPERNGIKPNENYARELMQLFSTGINQLNEDGSDKKDAQGNQLPVYTQEDVEAVARILTEYTYPAAPGTNTGFWESAWGFNGDMRPYDEFHDQGEKRILNNSIYFPSGGGAASEVNRLIKELVNHANTPPFIVKQMIQKSVTSNPSPAYMKRVVAVFKDNGSGVRGDLKSVYRAILLDPEARGARKIDPEYGRLREPALFWTGMLRALDVSTDGVIPYYKIYESNMSLFNSPTIFNYFNADFILPSINLPAPEFGIFSTAEYLTRVAHVNDLLYNNDQPYNTEWWGPHAYVPNATGTKAPSMAMYLTDAATPEVVIERMNLLFLHGRMTPAMRKTLINSVNKLPADNPTRRVKLIANLILNSVDYQIQK